MSDERFKLNDKGSFILEDGAPLKPLGNVVHKLNEQQATINHLKQELEEYKENWDDMVELATKTSLRNVELDEQIGQLRKELNDCEKFRYTVFKRMGELNDERRTKRN